MFTKKIIISVGVVLTMAASIAPMVFAEDNITGQRPMLSAEHAQKMVLEVGPGGRTLLRGTVGVVGTNSLTVKSWGGDWIINISSSTNLMPGSDMSQFNVGDFVGVQGVTSTSALWTVDATLVRDWTARVAVMQTREIERKERHNNQEEIKDVIKNESPRNWQGIASNINVDAKSFTLTVDGTAYTVNLVTNAMVVNKGFLNTNLVNVKSGDTVRVWGPVLGTTISAYVFRDVSLGQ